MRKDGGGVHSIVQTSEISASEEESLKITESLTGIDLVLEHKLES